MDAITQNKNKMLTSIIDFKDICDLFGQNGLICTGIAETLKEVLSEEQIKELINHLKTK